MNSKYEEAKEASKQNLEETQDIPTMVCVQEHNWLALISQLKLLTDTLFDVKAQTDETMTYAQMERYLRNQQTIFDQVLKQGQEIQEQKSRLQTAPTGGADRSVAPDIVVGIAAVASIIEGEPAEDTEHAREHVDSKALAEERERKEAHGIHMG